MSSPFRNSLAGAFYPLHRWLALKRLWLLDPATKRKVACTQLLPSFPTSVVLSHDGSRMAVLVNGGVHIYDVPEAFRK